MLTVDEAIARLTRDLQPVVDVELVPVAEAFNRVLAEEIVAPVNVPPADNSAMDGYAFCYADAQSQGFCLPVTQRIPAGRAPQPLQAGSAARIFTGAEIPLGADTVAMQEDCTLDGDQVTIAGTVMLGANIRPLGQDIKQGEIILRQGTRLRPQELGLVASVGMAEVMVYRPLRVAVFSTGDELVEAGENLKAGQIYNSNRSTLAGMLSAWSMELIDMGIARDDPVVIQDRFSNAAQIADVIVTSGGVSVGEEDYVKAVVEKLGSIDFWKIAMKPGKPLAFGQVHEKPFVGLPGNPAGVFVTALIFLRPLLLGLQGAAVTPLLPVKVQSLFARPAVKRQEYLRAKRTAEGVNYFPNQSSGMLSAACWGDGMVIQPEGQVIDSGDWVDFYSYRDFF